MKEGKKSQRLRAISGRRLSQRFARRLRNGRGKATAFRGKKTRPQVHPAPLRDAEPAEGQPARLALTHAFDNPPTAIANSLLLAGKGVPVRAHCVPSAPTFNAYFHSE